MSAINSYESRARKNSLLGTSDPMEAKGNVKEMLIQTGTALLLGGLAGSFAGQMIGKSSLLLGIAVTGASYYGGSELGVKVGIGMMASGYVSTTNPTSVNGIEDVKIRAKERAKIFTESLKARLFLDNIIKSKPQETTNGLGNVRYLVYPSQQGNNGSALDRIEKQIAESAHEFSQNYQQNSSINEISGLAEERII